MISAHACRWWPEHMAALARSEVLEITETFALRRQELPTYSAQNQFSCISFHTVVTACICNWFANLPDCTSVMWNFPTLISTKFSTQRKISWSREFGYAKVSIYLVYAHSICKIGFTSYIEALHEATHHLQQRLQHWPFNRALILIISWNLLYHDWAVNQTLCTADCSSHLLPVVKLSTSFSQC